VRESFPPKFHFPTPLLCPAHRTIATVLCELHKSQTPSLCNGSLKFLTLFFVGLYIFLSALFSKDVIYVLPSKSETVLYSYTLLTRKIIVLYIMIFSTNQFLHSNIYVLVISLMHCIVFFISKILFSY
jgi:hypothetical protein